MSNFHISTSGEANPCTAQTGKCPLGGEHYPSEEAAKLARNSATQIEALERKARMALVLANLPDTPKNEGMALRGEHAQFKKEADALRAAQVAAAKPLPEPTDVDTTVTVDLNRALPSGASPYLTPEEKARTASVLEREAQKKYGLDPLQASMYASDWTDASFWERQPTGEPSELSDYNERLAAKWARVGGEREHELRQTTEPTQSRVDYSSVPLEWTEALLDPEESELAASNANSYWKHRGELVLLARVMVHAAKNNKELQQSAHYDTMVRVAKLQSSPSDKRGGRRGQAKPIDPEFIAALRAMYLKQFNIDPFEQGMSIGKVIEDLQKAGVIKR